MSSTPEDDVKSEQEYSKQGEYMVEANENGAASKTRSNSDVSLNNPSNGFPTPSTNSSKADGPPKKKQMISRASVAYPRRRAVTACQICRLRKTKCDNERPTCGFCAKVGRFCVYDDMSVDQSKFDPASLAILGRVGTAINQLNAISARLGIRPDGVNGAATGSNTGSSGSPSNLPPVIIDNYISPFSGLTPSGSSSTNGNTGTSFSTAGIAPSGGVDDTYLEADSCSLNIPNGNMTAEKILQWPIFKDLPYTHNLTPYCYRRPESYDADVMNETYDLNYKEAPALVRCFLVNVHTKNTVCDVAAVQQYAWEIANNGPRWDTHTCIVLLLCALGTLAKPIDMKDFGVHSTSLTVGASRKNIAKRYFIEARKRIGLINRFSLDLAQCFFLSGQFHMYNLEPDLAWEDFHEACLICKTYLLVNSPSNLNTVNSISRSRTRSDSNGSAGAGGPGSVSSIGTAGSPVIDEYDSRDDDDPIQDKARQSLEQRLFWTCLKSEIELIVELPRPLSGIANVTYPVPFPAPPEDFSSTDGAFPNEDDVIFKDVQEQSWYHYLTEILLRRVSNELINSLYKCDFSEWLKTPLEVLLKIVERWEMQIAECYANLAPKIKFNFEEEPRSEILVFLSSRFLEMYEYLYRPIVYYAIHCPTSHPEVKRYVDKYFYYCDLKCVKVPNAHRHHGTWYHCRGNYTFALILLAAAKGGIIERSVEELREIVGFFITSLKYWEDESPDLKQPALLLTKILDDVCKSKDQQKKIA
ncbi:hypothetical protein AWJ20_3052 [Sugiyamaella lignohabitans]|uniref:Zn(2)-C6 fungal-type domain-containing protein n=1 Tax=Sugiyamaella lignohabitans TaxID=796027 RepID=A0A167FKS5_9ASCO|nr:uncharacterized protein AWJ20_3052 [Sugiyamaella lignohabitans]ANB15425.1 hypothetical protein AWJ20_3052 [Sugiyamaella lignohabitans]